MDSEKLKEKIKNSGLKLKYIAQAIGLTYAGLKLKIDGKREFTLSEVNKICLVLNITKKEKEEIFFNQ